MTNVFDEFRWRGLVYDFTEGLPEVLAQEKVTAYIGFDPTSNQPPGRQSAGLDGAGAGSSASATTRSRWQAAAPALIGDPSGKSQERQLQSQETIAVNVEAIRGRQLRAFLDFEVRTNPARIVNNADWLTIIPMMDFLRDVGKHFTVNYMMAKDSVKSAAGPPGRHLLAEFSYMLLQAYDFLQLHERFGCTLQAGGSDQWGNISAGVELIRRVKGGHGLRHGLPAGHRLRGREAGQDRAGHDLARSPAHLAVPLLPVLAEPARRRRGQLPALLHLADRGEIAAQEPRRRNIPNAGRRSARWPSRSHAWCMAIRQ